MCVPQCSLLDKEFYEKIKPLMEGEDLYKKFSSSSLSQQAFNPLDKEGKVTPESKGFGKRLFIVDSNLQNF
jgi:hypothetical protein